MKKLSLGLVGLIVLGFLGYIIYFLIQESNTVPKPFQPDEVEEFTEVDNKPCCFASFNLLKDAIFFVPGSDIPVTLKGGILSYDNGLSSGDVVPLGEFTRSFSKEDEQYLVVPIVAGTGGSGNFVYLILFKKNSEGYQQNSNFLLGDRIKVEEVEMYKNGEIKVSILNRAEGEPFSAIPSIEEDILLKIKDDKLVLNK